MENTKVLEYPIVITAVGAFIESPSSVRRRAQRLLIGDDERYIDVRKYVIQCLRICLITRRIGREGDTGGGQICL